MQENNFHRITINELDSLSLQRIFESLPLRQRVKVGQVNKKWNDISNRCWAKIHSLSIRSTRYGTNDIPIGLDEILIYDKLNCTFSIGIMKNCGQYLKKLCINVEYNVNNLLLNCALEYCNNLLSAELKVRRQVDNRLVYNLLGANSNLQTISLLIDEQIYYECLNGVPLNSLTSFYLNCPFIAAAEEEVEDEPGEEQEVVRFDINFMKAVKRIIRGAPYLQVCVSHAMDDEVLLLLTQKPMIKSLVFPAVLPQYFTQEGLSYIFNMSRLEKLCMEFRTPWLIPLINDNFLIQLTRHCKKIQFLRLAGCGLQITDTGVVYLTHLKHLTRLSICNAEYITDVSVQGLVNLTYLCLSHCREVGNNGIIRLLRRTSTLEKIYLDGTNITETTIICANEFTRRRNQKLNMVVSEIVYSEALKNHSPFFAISSLATTGSWRNHTWYFHL